MLNLKKRVSGAVRALTGSELTAKERAEAVSHRVLIGTHHKTGTVWLRNVFIPLCRELGLIFHAGKQKDLPLTFNVFLENHSQFELDKIVDDYRGLHIIRDPRDRIVSGCFYHQKSSEEWLHVKRDDFDGMTYQEKICSLPTLEDKLHFEMENSGANGIREMLSWDYNNESFIEIQYEDLIEDRDLTLFHKIFTFLSFSGRTIPIALKHAYENSLFSGSLQKSVHIRSGKARQWEKHFQPDHKQKFVELFGDALIQLGYEKNNDWAKIG